MEYFKINGHDYSMYTNSLVITKQHNYDMITSAGGKDRITYRYARRLIDVGIIPLDSETMAQLLADINQFRVTVSFLEPETNTLVENLECIVPQNLVEYYTIQAGNVKYKALSLRLQEVNYIGGVVS